MLELVMAWASKDGLDQRSAFDLHLTITTVVFFAPVAAIVALVPTLLVGLALAASHAVDARSRRS